MEALVIALRVVCGVVVLDVVLAYLVPPQASLRRLTRRLTAPLYRPVQRVCDPRRLGVDFAPMVVVMGLTTLAWLLAPELVG